MRVVKQVVVTSTGFVISGKGHKGKSSMYVNLGAEPDENTSYEEVLQFQIEVEPNADGYCPLKVGQKVKVVITNEE